jgi:hypothetical protein
MKLDWNLMRKIVLAVEDTPIGTVQRQPSVNGVSADEVGYHVHLLLEAGLARGNDVTNVGHTHPHASISGLTSAGHEFAELVRGETRWSDAMAEARRTGAITLDRLKHLLATPNPRQSLEEQSATALDTVAASTSTSIPNAGEKLSAPGGDTDPQFSGQHKAEFRELLAAGIELYAINSHPSQLDFGPWSVCCDQKDPDTKSRIKARFRAAARKAAIAAGAPYRTNLLDWWVSKLARGRRLPFIQGLIQRSVEQSEEMESNAAELRAVIDESNTPLGLRRDRYPCERPVPYWLYTEPHRTLPDGTKEFAYWDKFIWDSFASSVEQLASSLREKRRWVDEDGKKHVQPKEDIRQRAKKRVEQRTKLLDAWILGLSYDVAVLQANYVIDRGFQTESAMRTFARESAELVEKVGLSWRTSCKRLGLSWKKQERRGADLAKPFQEVAADLRHLLFSKLLVKDASPAVESVGPDRSADIAPAVVPPAPPELTPKRFDADPQDDPTLGPVAWRRFSPERTSAKFLALLRYNLANFSIPAPLTNREVVVKIAKGSQIPIESLCDDISHPVFPRGQVIVGYVGDEIDKIARNYPFMRWWVSDSGLNMAILSAEEIKADQEMALLDRIAAQQSDAPSGANAVDRSASSDVPAQENLSLTALLRAQTPSDQRLRKMYEAVIRYNWYLKELRALKVASKKHQTPDLLKKQFPEFEVWSALDKDDERDIASGDFDPGRCAWALVQRLNNQRGKDDRTLQNYRKGLRRAGIPF